ncbi:hypothetical protein E4P42_08295 [Mycobacterium sp. PS03-16]|uniref:hypothetical protein n=1 Tax=Mycobacterium sp. PS03-16 TaxID=2559611 RepID=UPI00107415BF|nr:hypothetical protein [Mycobacterium sp. PS03-16]TFV59403.1 hypothetical protein E4P42_08295 [Mycobacterium sp. PS03-16]
MPSKFGPMGPVIVGISAIVVSALFNVWTLQRSAKTLRLAEKTFERTEEKYRFDRLAARNDKLREALLAVQTSVDREWMHAIIELERATRACAAALRESELDASKLQAAMHAMNQAQMKQMLPALNSAGIALSNLRFLAEGIEELMVPLRSLTSALTAVDQSSIPDAPPGPDWYEARSEALVAQRLRTTECATKLTLARMRLFVRDSHRELPS